MNLPNRITLARIIMIPFFIVVFYLDVIPYNFLVASFVYCVVAFTDAIDGYIARKRNLVTNMGKFLDPIADKVLVSTAFILMLTRPEIFNFLGDWGIIVAGVCVALILARELIISGFRMIAAGQNAVIAADNLGKIKTIVQDIAIAVTLAAASFLHTQVGVIFAYIGVAFVLLCTILTVVSGINYIVKNKHVLKS